ncbi:MAG: UDP-3-O-(3-hydroxymyristoyl)glucosamine N-acyltransferase [Bacteroidota bacterium]|nr:UDP-3-O-(3-hydroxymyristoyl)glucosamine N-acyltransferase [Bacteroidota bacterium]
MELTARQIAETLHGRVDGNPDVIVSKLAKIEEGTPGSISFLANPLYEDYIYKTGASIVVVNENFEGSHPISATLIRVENAYTSFAQLLEIFNRLKPAKSGISPYAFISKSAKTGENVYLGEFSYVGEDVVIGNNVTIYPQVYLGDHVIIGDHTTLHAGVKIYNDCVIGSHCILHSGVVIGADGFGFASQPGKEYKKIIQSGNVVIEDDVEIGANTTIDRATLGSTKIHRGVKLDNLIQIAHNVEIGENTVIVAQVGVAGSTKIGKNCIIAGQAGIVGHLSVADNTIIGAQSGVEKSIRESGGAYLGSPAVEAGKARRNIVHLRNIDNLVKRVNELERRMNKEKPE